MLERCFRLRSLVLILLGLVLTTPDATAAPQTNSPPNTPITLGPPDQGVDVPIDFDLGWYCSDPDGDPLVFDVYFGVAPNVQLVAANVTGPVYDPGMGAYDTIYNWYIVARDSHGAETQGPTWTFTTRPENFVPTVPSDPSPPDNATIQPISPALHWESYDNDGETVLFDVFLGTSDPPALVASNFAAHTYNASGLSYDTQYYWKIIAHDPHGAVSTGPTWTFRTRLSNYPPAVPSSPFPLDNAANVLIPNLQRNLSWQSSDPDNDVLRYDVYFGTATPPPLVVSNQLSSSYTAQGLAFVTAYYWRIVVRDAKGVEVSGPEWTFTTEANDPPNVPSNPSPQSLTGNQPLAVSLTWFCSDPESWQSLSYDVYFGPETAPPLVASGLTDRFWGAGSLAIGTTYYWRVVAHDPFGLSRNGPLWAFTTLVDLPPTVPANPSPADGTQLSGSPSVVLSWTSTDPENQSLSYKIHFGVSPNPPLLTTVSTSQYNLGVIGANLLFYWYIVVSDAHSSVTGPVWTFRSGPGNVPPNAPANPSPADNATDIATNPTLSWEGTDPNGDGLLYDVYFGSTSPPPLRASSVSVSNYGLSQLNVSTDYYWQIAARDGSGLVTTGSIWKFRTSANGTPAPGSWAPSDGAVNVPRGVTLMWRVTDQDDQATTYDVLFGETPDPPLVASNLATALYTPGPLTLGALYYWRVLAHDGTNLSVGPLLTFTTASTVTGAGVIPLELTLGQSHPNPFNPQTIIPYTVPKGAPLHVRIMIFDAIGRPVRTLVDETQSAGAREVLWKGDDDRGTVVSSGVYYCVLQAGEKRRTQKLVLLK